MKNTFKIRFMYKHHSDKSQRIAASSNEADYVKACNVFILKTEFWMFVAKQPQHKCFYRLICKRFLLFHEQKQNFVLFSQNT